MQDKKGSSSQEKQVEKEQVKLGIKAPEDVTIMYRGQFFNFESAD